MKACWSRIICVCLLLLTSASVSRSQDPEVTDGVDGEEPIVPPTPPLIPEVEADPDLPSDGQDVPSISVPGSSDQIGDYHIIKETPDSSNICILADFTASLTIQYESTNGSRLSLTDTPGDGGKVTWTGQCGDTPILTLKWHDGQCELTFKFGKDDTNWYADTITYQYTKSKDAGFKKPKGGGVSQVMCQPGSKFFTTPRGSYHMCDEEEVIKLSPSGGGVGGDSVELRLTHLTMQVYDVPGSDKLDETKKHQCPASGASTDSKQKPVDPALKDSRSTAAVAVGICVALITVGIVVGYAARRYYRERISYSTM